MYQTKLPPLNQPPNSAKVSSLNEYRRWQDNKKRSYRAQLDRQMEQRRRSRQKSLQLKDIERLTVSMLAQDEKTQEVSTRHAKIKTQQKYMQDNFNLMKKSNLQRRVKEWGSPGDHPFVVMIDEEEKRRKQTKNNFVFQNKLNDIQTNMKRSSKRKKKELSEMEGKNYVEYVEAQFQKQLRQRMKFQQKYLNIDKSGSEDYKKEHLRCWQEESSLRRSQMDKKMGSRKQRTGSMIGGQQIFHSPYRLNGQQKVRNRQQSTSSQKIDHDLSLCKQYDMKIGNQPSNYSKMLTQKTAQETDATSRAQSSLTDSHNPIRYKEMKSHPKKQYKHYDIINNCSKVIVS